MEQVRVQPQHPASSLTPPSSPPRSGNTTGSCRDACSTPARAGATSVTWSTERSSTKTSRRACTTRTSTSTHARPIPFEDDYFDAIICNAVLEHVADPQAVMAEFARVCRPGGFLYLAVPFMQPEHPDPTDFQRSRRSARSARCMGSA